MMLLENQPEEETQTGDRLKDRFKEQELSRTQRALRFQVSGGHGLFLKQNQNLNEELHKRLQEKASLDLLLSAVLSKPLRKKYENQLTFITNNIDCQKELDKEIMNVKTHIDQIKSQLRRLLKEEMNLKKVELTEYQYQEQLRKTKRNYDIKLRHLEVLKQREGILSLENQNLRKIIEKMMYLRGMFNKNWQQLVSELSQNKRFLIDLIERSMLAFAKNEEYYMRIQMLEQRDTLIKNNQIAEILQIFRKLDAVKIYQEFLKAKGFYRKLAPLDEHEVKRRQFVEKELTRKFHLHTKIIEKILEKYSNTFKIEKEAAKKAAAKEKEQKKLKPVKPENQKEDEVKLKEKELKEKELKKKEIVKRKSLVEEVIDEYTKNEEHHFANFKYLNEIYNQFEFLRSSIEKKQIKLASVRDTQKSNKNKMIAEIKKINASLTDAKKSTVAKQKEHDSNEILLRKYMDQINAIFGIMKCDTQFIQSLLGDNKKVTNFNIKLFLSAMETKMNKMLAYIYYREQKAKVPAEKSIVKVPSRKISLVSANDVVGTTQCSECAEREDVNRFSDAIVLPSTSNERKERIKNRLLGNELEYRMHNLSKCRLPRSRVLVNKRYM